MIETEIDIETADGLMNTFVVKPDGGEELPLVVVLMDASGVRDELRSISRRIAQAGYVVALPNLYYRAARVFDSGVLDSTAQGAVNMKRMLDMLALISASGVMADVASLLDQAPFRVGCGDGKVGLVGYCVSGSFVTLAAASFPSQVGCFASFYGTRLVTDAPDSPHKLMGAITAEGYFAFGADDAFIPLEDVVKLREAVAVAGCRAPIDVVSGAQHNFVFTDRGTLLDHARESHFERILDLCRRNLS